MKKTFTIVIILLPFLISFAQDTHLKVYNKTCILNSGPVKCQDFIQNLQSYYKSSKEDEADFSIETHLDFENPNPSSIIYKVTIQKKNETSLTLKKEYTRITDDLFIIQDIVKSVNEIVEEQFQTLVNISDSNIYASPSLDGNYNQSSGNKNFRIGLGGQLSYITPRWRLSFGGGTNFSKEKQSQTATVQEYEVIDRSYRYGISAIRSLKNPELNLLLGLGNHIVDFKHSETTALPPIGQENIARHKSLTLGIEWIKKPFVKESQGNISVQTQYRLSRHNYVDPVSYEYVDEIYQIGKVRVTWQWYINENNLISTSISAYKDFHKGKYQGAQISLSPVFTITPNLTFNPSIYASVTRNRILSPTVSGRSNFLVLTGSNANDPLSLYTNFRLLYNIGNFAKNNQDRRWR